MKNSNTFATVSYNDDWALCVSTATSFLSTNWKETFFADEEEARRYAKHMKQCGYAVLTATFDEY